MTTNICSTLAFNTASNALIGKCNCYGMQFILSHDQFCTQNLQTLMA